MRKNLQKISVIALFFILFSVKLTELSAQVTPAVVNGPVGSVINVAADGTIKYWNINNWSYVPLGYPGQNLQFNLGAPPSWIDNPFGITTQNASLITSSSAKSGGNIHSNGGAPITARGVCWGIAHNPTLANSFTTDGVGVGPFESQLTLLSPNTTYYVRTYATNSKGTLYGNEISFTTAEVILDNDGNQYTAVQIGSQIWMKPNLAVTTYNNGSSITQIADASTFFGSVSGAYDYLFSDPNQGTTFGVLYNWYAVSTGNLCPIGWRVPSNSDWNTLGGFLGGESIAGGKLKEVGLDHWQAPNAGATDEFGFKALPGAMKSNVGYGVWQYVNNWGAFWTSDPYDANSATCRYIDASSTGLNLGSSVGKNTGMSVRCLKN